MIPQIKLNKYAQVALFKGEKAEGYICKSFVLQLRIVAGERRRLGSHKDYNLTDKFMEASDVCD
jgi:hypothetical protein